MCLKNELLLNNNGRLLAKWLVNEITRRKAWVISPCFSILKYNYSFIFYDFHRIESEIGSTVIFDSLYVKIEQKNTKNDNKNNKTCCILLEFLRKLKWTFFSVFSKKFI